MVKSNHPIKSRLSRLALFASLALSALGAAPFAAAGTYSVIGVDWFPTTAPGIGANGGYIHFGNPSLSQNPLDLYYGLAGHASAPFDTYNNTYANPTVSGIWKWKVRWVGEVGETAPYEVLATIQVKGGASAATAASCYTAGYTSTAHSTVSDPYFPVLTVGSTADYYYYPTDSDSAASPFNGSQTAYSGATFTLVSGTTYEGTVSMSIQSQAGIDASGSGTQMTGPKGIPLYSIYSSAGGTATLDAIMRLTHIAGQRVQLDL